MIKGLRFLALLILAVGRLHATDPAPKAAKSDHEELRWAAAVDSNAPFAFYDKNNRLTGFEYEIIEGIARHMAREPKFIQNSWDGLIPGLGRGLYDCVICGIEITAEKGQEVLFSNPYYITFEQLVVAKGTPAVTSLTELSGRKVGTLEQTAALRMLQETPNVVVKSYAEEVNAYHDVANGRLYAVLLDFPIAKYYAARTPRSNSRALRSVRSLMESLSRVAVPSWFNRSMRHSGRWCPVVNSAIFSPAGDSGPQPWQQP